MSDLLSSLWIVVGAQTWQLALLIVAVWSLHYRFARQRPHLAMALWLVVLAKCITPPLWSSPSGVFCWLQPPRLSVDAAKNPVPMPKVLDDETWKVVDPTNEQQLRSIENDLYVNDQVSSPWRSILLFKRSLTAAFDSHSSHRWKAFVPWLIGAWLVGLSFVGMMSLLHWLRFLRQLGRTACRTDKRLSELADDLARRLGVRRPVNVLVSSGRTGPAVIGLWRPRIVMPAVLVDNRQIAQLEPLLAHELLHVRRGDLWLSVLQAVARTVWWFHPLVWMAMSRITREAERCCDEAVLAELGCKPAYYARSLLDVLERKRLFQAVPLFPGVRPVDITTSRLERIMSLRHGCRRRSPWWCWGVLIGLAAVVLPGAGHLVDATEPASRSYQSVQSPKKRVAPSEWQLVDVPERDASRKQQQEPAHTYVKAYALRDLLDEFGKADGTDEATSKKALMEWLKQSVAIPDSPQNDGAKLFGRGIESDAGVVGELMVDDEKFTWYEDQLIVRLDQSGHERLANEIAQRQEYGFKEIAIRTWIISGDARTIRKLFDEWEVGEVLKSPTATVSPDTVGNRDNTLGPNSSVASRITVKTEKHYPPQVASLNEKQSQQLLRRVQADRRGNVMQAPKVTLLNGQRASIQDVSFRPFVVGFRKTVPANSDAGSNASTPSADAVLARRLPPGFEPEIQVISEGTTLRLAPTLRDNDRVTIEFDIRLASIRGVETTQFKLGSENKPVKVQTPVVSSMQVASTVTCRMGESIAVGGLEMVDAEDKSQSMLVLLSPELPAWEDGAVDGK